ncbi:DUF1772 domain-containing protein [Kangiella sp. TOML190]|uniref:DUF1772 domain-containing protein n=1 Tax=Kangiella sp. TOML190 TaxID=2931351 RepID=UPI00203AC4C8|nr:DUF1772 domain-containing protein [Kangiella sp. TOML190]
MFEIVALLCCGTFFGASIYINLAQHPATLDAGGDFAGQFFPPMYAKASTLQIALAVLGFLFGLVSWYQSNDILWIIGSLFLISVIPITLFFIKPINDQLLDENNDLSSEQIESLLKKWNPRHGVRSLVSGIAFISFAVSLAG